MARPIVHFEINGQDGKALHEFYSKLFDWKVDAQNEWSYGMVSAEDAGVGGGISQADEASVIVYVAVPDLQACLAEAERLGGKILVPPTEVPGFVTFAQFADPAGNRFGIVKE